MWSEVPETEGARRSLAVAATVGRRQRTVLTVVALAAVEPNPEQPRRYFAEDKLAELAASILERGLLQPIVVCRRPDGGFQLLAGERRFRGAQLAGVGRPPGGGSGGGAGGGARRRQKPPPWGHGPPRTGERGGNPGRGPRES